jgi:hypothetical protein
MGHHFFSSNSGTQDNDTDLLNTVLSLQIIDSKMVDVLQMKVAILLVAAVVCFVALVNAVLSYIITYDVY